MNSCSRRLALSLGLLFTFAGASISGAATVFLKSGNVPPSAIDPGITFYAEPSGQCATPFAAPFTAADFAAADAGPNAWSLPAYGAWGASLVCDPTTSWVSTAPGWPSRSTLYSVPFDVNLPAPCCIQKATLQLCWMADDLLGDVAPFGGPNPIGVYVNGLPTTITGGNYASQTIASDDITALLHCGLNHLYLYNRDAGCAVSGINFSARIDYIECVTSAKKTSWGAVRSLYRD
jgi:hypothetical protein